MSKKYKDHQEIKEDHNEFRRCPECDEKMHTKTIADDYFGEQAWDRVSNQVWDQVRTKVWDADWFDAAEYFTKYPDRGGK